MKQVQRARVIVQTVTFNSAETIGACVRSVQKQRYGDMLFVVIDNNSTDNTRAILGRVGVRTVLLPKNVGYAAAHNIGLRTFNSDYVLTLNPDMVIDRDFVGSLTMAMDKAQSAVGSAQAFLYRVERMGRRSTIVDSTGLYMTPFRRQNLRLAGKIQKPEQLSPAYIFGPDGAAAFYRRAMLIDIDQGNGVFDEDYFMHKEDVDVCWRAQLRGWRSVFVPGAVGYHIRSFRPGRRVHMHAPLRTMALRNRYYLMIKNDLPLLWIRNLPWIALYDLGIFLYVLFWERESLPAYAQVLKNFRSIFKKRMRIQRSRRASTAYMSRWFQWRPQ